jgi:hypothetical protein
MECKLSVDGWSYRVRADDTRWNIICVPEARVRAVSKTIFESPMLETRAFPVQQRLKAEQRKSATLRVKNKALRLENPVFAGDWDSSNRRMSVYLYASAISSCVDFIASWVWFIYFMSISPFSNHITYFLCLDRRLHIEWIRGILKMLFRDQIMSVLATGISSPKVANIYPNEIINIFI